MADESYPMKIAGGVYISCGSHLNSFPVTHGLTTTQLKTKYDTGKITNGYVTIP